MTASGVQWALRNSLTRREYISYLPVPSECSWGNVREGLTRQALLQCWRRSLGWLCSTCPSTAVAPPSSGVPFRQRSSFWAHQDDLPCPPVIWRETVSHPLQVLSLRKLRPGKERVGTPPPSWSQNCNRPLLCPRTLVKFKAVEPDEVGEEASIAPARFY